MEKKLAILDFDGTITHRDVFLPIILYIVGIKKFSYGLLILLPKILSYLFRIISNHTLKNYFIKTFLKDMKVEFVIEEARIFYESQRHRVFSKKALAAIKDLQIKGYECIIISANLYLFIFPFAQSIQVKVLATELETNNERITGSINGNNCYGMEKLNRLKEYLNLAEYKEIKVFTDNHSDTSLMQIATTTYFRTF